MGKCNINGREISYLSLIGQYHQSNVILLFCCVVVLMYCRCIVVLLYCCVGVLLCCCVVVLSCCRVVVLVYCGVVKLFMFKRLVVCCIYDNMPQQSYHHQQYDKSALATALKTPPKKASTPVESYSTSPKKGVEEKNWAIRLSM
jgi:hypothetical protein